MSQRGQGWLPFPWWLNTLLNNRSPLVCETSHHIWTVVCTIHSPDLLQVLSPLFMVSNLSVKATPHISSNSLHSLTKRREEMVGYHTLLLVPPAFHSHTLNLHSVPSAGICLHSSYQGCSIQSGIPRMRRGWGLVTNVSYVCTRHNAMYSGLASLPL